MIVQQDGRSKSVRTIAEELKLYEEDLAGLSTNELDALTALLSEPDLDGTIELFEAANEAEFETIPVGVEEFLRNDYFLGDVGKNLYPILMDDIVELFEGGYSEAILTGSLGYGKTFFSALACLYILYQMSCLRHPQISYGIDEGSYISLSFLSASEKSARRAVFSELVTKLDRSPYFQEMFPYKQYFSEVKFLRKPVMLVAGSTASNAILSLNIFGGIMDEGNFLGQVKTVQQKASRVRWAHVGRAERLYHTIIRRMKSRYMHAGKLPGILFMPSSKTVVSSFTEKRIKDARDDPTVFVRDYATWDVKKRYGMFRKERFNVLIGNERINSKILEPGEEKNYENIEGVRIIEVPEDYRRDFERDLEDAIREVAGMATLGLSLFFQRRDKIAKICEHKEVVPEHPFTVNEWQTDKPGGFMWGRICKRVKKRLPGGFTEDGWEPILNPHVPRHVRLDPSLTGDATGIAVGHIAGYTEVVRRDENGKEYSEVAPKIIVDFVLRVVPPLEDEIMLGTVRSLIYQLQEHGFNITYASSDSWQSADTKQKLKQRGIDCEIFSVDADKQPYQTLKVTVYEERLFCYPYAILLDELKFLEYDAVRGRVDHPEDGSKDVADAVCGLVYSLTMKSRPAPIPPMTGRDESPETDESWVTDGWKMVKKEESGGGDGEGGEGGGLPPMPFLTG